MVKRGWNMSAVQLSAQAQASGQSVQATQNAMPVGVNLTQQQGVDELAKVFQEIFADIANLAVSFGLVDVVALVEEVDGGKELVQNIRKLLKDFKKLQDVLQKTAAQRQQQQQTVQPSQQQ